jgi:hypothetical protein
MRKSMLVLATVGLVATMASAATVTSPNDRVTVGGQHLAFGTGPDLVADGESVSRTVSRW